MGRSILESKMPMRTEIIYIAYDETKFDYIAYDGTKFDNEKECLKYEYDRLLLLDKSNGILLEEYNG